MYAYVYVCLGIVMCGYGLCRNVILIMKAD